MARCFATLIAFALVAFPLRAWAGGFSFEAQMATYPTSAAAVQGVMSEAGAVPIAVINFPRGFCTGGTNAGAACGRNADCNSNVCTSTNTKAFFRFFWPPDLATDAVAKFRAVQTDLSFEFGAATSTRACFRFSLALAGGGSIVPMPIAGMFGAAVAESIAGTLSAEERAMLSDIGGLASPFGPPSVTALNVWDEMVLAVERVTANTGVCSLGDDDYQGYVRLVRTVLSY